MNLPKPKNVDEYINNFPPQVQEALIQIRESVKRLVPEAEETISYGIPTFKLNGTYLIYFAAYTSHISIYPVAVGNLKFNTELEQYQTSGRGTIRFPLNKSLPMEVIQSIIKFLLEENMQRKMRH